MQQETKVWNSLSQGATYYKYILVPEEFGQVQRRYLLRVSLEPLLNHVRKFLN